MKLSFKSILKDILYVAIAAAVLIFLFRFSGAFGPNSGPDYYSVTLTTPHGDISVTSNEKAIAARFAELVGDPKNTVEPPPEGTPMLCTVTWKATNRSDTSYDVFVTGGGDPQLYGCKAVLNHFYDIDQAELLALLSLPEFSQLYDRLPREVVPTMTVSLEGEKAEATALEGSRWECRLPAGQKEVWEGKMPAALQMEAESEKPLFIFSSEPDSLEIIVTLPDGSTVDYDAFVPGKTGGDHTFTLHAVWDDPSRQATGAMDYRVAVTYPDTEPAIHVNTDGLRQGSFLTVEIENVSSDTAITAQTDLPCEVVFALVDDRAIALVPVAGSAPAGNYYLCVTADTVTAEYGLTVDEGGFAVQHLTVDSGTAADTVYSDEANWEFSAKVGPLKTVVDSEIYWDGAFLLPLAEPLRVTTEFGMTRYINQSPTPSYHFGVDLAAAADTEIYAPAAGRVLLAENLKLTGNTILIEHGLGLKTYYYHMNALAVSAGEMVSPGQIIGYVGSTGFSTGPHLHFAASVGKVFVNPWPLFESDPLERN